MNTFEIQEYDSVDLVNKAGRRFGSGTVTYLYDDDTAEVQIDGGGIDTFPLFCIIPKG